MCALFVKREAFTPRPAIVMILGKKGYDEAEHGMCYLKLGSQHVFPFGLIQGKVFFTLKRVYKSFRAQAHDDLLCLG